ncbi:MAG: Eco57I restriction-modification methylase domain-containing protein [Spirochaetales bacterium]|uniref:site-specific DNA-methyltransferase (adenine-specific) n=1 Tax=Candidatus Thalassospirochaeta sargassi TaxID=3119039 RepID=A0AAJ1IK86_9SPIO|nr:Eco57I restriction-modification methylase domain-containing protein [Spirochaetales bacterium]
MLNSKKYNPDVLSCLANLSNDEVFTPPRMVNDILDMLPQELFHDCNTTFLDPVSKSGVFLREIAKRLIVGIENEIPDLQTRLNHIFSKQLFGIAITEITSLLSRRSVYCSKIADGKYSVCEDFENEQGNIIFSRTEHKWIDGKCFFCSANQETYERGYELETHAYQFIHTTQPEEIFNMKFDVIIGNPPYQLSDGGNQSSALPIYQKFIQQAKKLQPRFLSMIVPARWFTGGRGLDTFRDEMLNDDRIRVIHDFVDSSDCFPGVEIKGGVCYFLWERDSEGLCSVYEHSGENFTYSKRPLLEVGMETFIRNERAISILKKVREKKEKSFSDMLNGGRFFGFHTRIIWIDDNNGSIQTADGKDTFPIKKNQDKDFCIKVYIAHGECWIEKKSIKRNLDFIDQYKVIIPRSGNPGSTILGKPKISEPNSCSSNTYVVAILPSKSDLESKNIISYLKSNFLRFLVSLKTSTQDMPPKAYEFVPIQDFTKSWDDKKLYDKYNITRDEIDFIESMVKPMDLGEVDND